MDNYSYENTKGLITEIEEGKLIVSFAVDGNKYSTEKCVNSTSEFKVGHLMNVEYDRLDPSICRASIPKVVSEFKSDEQKAKYITMMDGVGGLNSYTRDFYGLGKNSNSVNQDVNDYYRHNMTIKTNGYVEMLDERSVTVVYEACGRNFKKLFLCEGYSKHYIGEVVGIEYEVENPDFAKITQYIPKKKNNAEYVTKVLEERYKAEHNIQSSSSYEADYGYAQTDYGDNRNDYANVDMGFNQAAEDAYYNDESRWGTGFSSEGYSDYDSQYNEYDSQYSDYSSQSKYSKNGMDAKKGSGTKDIVSALGILGLIGVCIAYYIYSYGLPF